MALHSSQLALMNTDRIAVLRVRRRRLLIRFRCNPPESEDRVVQSGEEGLSTLNSSEFEALWTRTSFGGGREEWEWVEESARVDE